MIKKEKKYTYFEAGEGTPIIVLHGLMGGLSNFDGVANFFPSKGYKVIIPELPIYTQSLLKTNVKAFARYVKDFITFKGLERVILVGNSLGGHIGLYFTKQYPELVKGLVITGSSGLYESAMGESYPKRGDYEYIRKKAEDVFYNPEVVKTFPDFFEIVKRHGIEAISTDSSNLPAPISYTKNLEKTKKKLILNTDPS